jgi:hypothetical protein
MQYFRSSDDYRHFSWLVTHASDPENVDGGGDAYDSCVNN